MVPGDHVESGIESRPSLMYADYVLSPLSHAQHCSVNAQTPPGPMDPRFCFCVFRHQRLISPLRLTTMLTDLQVQNKSFWVGDGSAGSFTYWGNQI